MMHRKTFKLFFPLVFSGILYVTPAEADSLTVSLTLFSGRMPPLVNVTDSARVASGFSALQARLTDPQPYAKVPDMPSTPEYNGIRIRFSVPGSVPKAYSVRQGWIYSTNTEPAYRDSGSLVEKLIVTAAFHEKDLNHPAGPTPMAYLACMVPDSLHPDTPCPGTLVTAPRKSARTGSRPTGLSWHGFNGGFDALGRFRGDWTFGMEPWTPLLNR